MEPLAKQPRRERELGHRLSGYEIHYNWYRFGIDLGIDSTPRMKPDRVPILGALVKQKRNTVPAACGLPRASMLNMSSALIRKAACLPQELQCFISRFEAAN